jgi:NhaP-type Na+/H+ or K+/H+ antiporter
MLTLFMGLVCKEINKKLGIPYTPLLIVVGALFGATKFWGRISEATENSKLIEPHDIL